MWKYLRHIHGSLDRTKNTKWGRRAAIGYAFGTWTLLGLFFAKWKKDGLTSEPATDDVPMLTEEEKQHLKEQKLLEIKRRNEETSLHVAENVYTPLDFMS